MGRAKKNQKRLKNMKNKTVLTVLAAGALGIGALTQSASGITLNFGNIQGSTVHFDGASHFTFLPGNGGNQFSITSVTGGVGDSVSDLGYISSVSPGFTIGSVTHVGATYYAGVTGSGVLHISDGTKLLTGDLTWTDISTTGAGGTINVNAVLNLTSIVYAGSSQTDLTALAAPGIGTEVVTFQFTSTETLTALKTHNIGTSFSGSISSPAVPDGAMTMALLGFAMMGVEGLRRRVCK